MSSLIILQTYHGSQIQLTTIGIFECFEQRNVKENNINIISVRENISAFELNKPLIGARKYLEQNKIAELALFLKTFPDSVEIKKKNSDVNLRNKKY